jgi:hypothetical protein
MSGMMVNETVVGMLSVRWQCKSEHLPLERVQQESTFDDRKRYIVDTISLCGVWGEMKDAGDIAVE